MHFPFQPQDLLENNVFFVQNSPFHIQTNHFFIVHFVSVDTTQQTGTADIT
jgi:hypothetical protein